MNRKIALIILPVIALGLFAAYEVHNETSVKHGGTADYKLLVLLIDDTEPQGGGGPGAVDMAYIITLNNGSLTNMTPIYPGSMKEHPTASPPPELVANETHLKLVDSFYWKDTTNDAKLAQQIVEYSTGTKTDGVVTVKPAAVNAIIDAVGPVYVPGEGYASNNSLNFVRIEQSASGGNMSRGAAVNALANAIKNATNNNAKFPQVLSVISTQYAQGNIQVYPSSLFTQIMAEEGLKKIFG